MNEIVSRIYELMAKSGIRKKDLSDKIGVSRNTIQNWKKFDAMPTLSVIEKICEVFNISTEQFFSGMGNLEGDKAEREFIDDWRMLSDTEKLAVEKVMCAFKELKAVHND